MLSGLMGLRLSEDLSNHELAIAQNTKELLQRGSKEYALGVVDMYKRENPTPSKLRKMLGLTRMFEDSLYIAAQRYLGVKQ